MMTKQTIGQYLAVAFIFVSFAISLHAAENTAKPAPSLKDRIGAADKQVREKKHDEAKKALLALEKETGLDDTAKCQIYVLLMNLYGANTNAAKKAEYAQKVLSLPAADARQKTEVLTYLASECDYGRQYGANFGLYVDMQPKEVLEKMKKDNQLYCEELVALNPSNAVFHITLGNLFIRNGTADKAAAEFKSALGLPALSPMQQGDALTGLASAALLKGDRAASIKYCEELVSRNLETMSQDTGRSMDPVGQAKYALQFMKGPELDYLKLPYYTGAKAFPTPQRAKYTEDFVALTSVKLVLGKDIKPDDVRLGLLKAKFGRFGITFADNAPFAIKINTESAPKAPEKDEGYALTVSKDGAIINSYDAQGTLWGIVSLIQLVNLEKTPKVRIAEIFDYPDTARRGFLQDSWKYALEYMLFCKMNTVVLQKGGPQVVSFHDPLISWTPLQKEICKDMSRTFASFGTDIYYGIYAWTMFYMLPLSSERTFDLHYEICSEIAQHGGHIYFPYDDARFPLPKADLEKFGSAAAMDAKYLTRLFKAVREKNPGFRMVFCPPFYWGPADSSYPEATEPYLESLGDYLDPEIEVFWTGPRVKGYTKTRQQVKWFTDLTKHKPMIFQNGTGPHNTLSYITDETPGWKTWHYYGFFENDIEGFLKNAEMGREAPQTATLADCLWNIKAYDAAASIRNAVAMLYGREMFDILDPANKALAYLDKYPYGERVVPEAMAERLEIEKRVKIAEDAYTKGLEYNKFSLENFPGWLGSAVGWYKNFAETLKKKQ